MSHELINRNADLKRLRDEGYDVGVSDNHLLIRHVPYVNDQRQVLYGILASKLDLSGDSTVKPSDHVAFWVGDYPCDSQGVKLSNLVNNPNLQQPITDGLVATCLFSQKPSSEGYSDYHHKMTQYVRMLEGEARALEPSATAKTFLPVELTEEESVFCYMDTASSRAGIISANAKLKKDKIAIVGLGGTGSYILDLLAKTPVGEIHIFDDDRFLQHNAFRSPGAPSVEDLTAQTTKVEWLVKSYSKIRRKIIPHVQRIDESSVAELSSMDAVFLCVDAGAVRRVMVDYLVENKIPFIDAGIGLLNNCGTLSGSVRITACTPSYSGHIASRIPSGGGNYDEYSSNIQIADMNALAAVLAVIKWKKMCGFYHDFRHEHHSVYGISTNTLTNDEVANEDGSNQTQVC